VLDGAPCGVMTTLDEGTFVRVNATFCKWIGRAAEDLVGRRRLQDLLTMGGRIFHQTHWMPLLQMQGSISEVKLEVVHKDGQVIPMILNAIRRERGGRMVHDLAAYVARDRDKYERELVRARHRLEELVAETKRLHEEAKDRALFAEQILGIVSHDLRNPMSTIQMGVALLGRTAASPSQERTLERMQRSTERANRLISDLLDFTQARMGKGLAVAPKRIDVHESIGAALEELTFAFPGRALKHERNGTGECVADAGRLAQAVGNLVANAMTYGRPDSAVTVTTSIQGATFSVSVHNDGDPIPPELRDRIFEPMTRGSAAPSAVRSVGLGLFIVSEIAKAHGGRAVVTSTAEAGTTFSLVLPRGVD
jgi:sigma-B regulation protein RsbU (phosphoserine phosphatase)